MTSMIDYALDKAWEHATEYGWTNGPFEYDDSYNVTHHEGLTEEGLTRIKEYLFSNLAEESRWHPGTYHLNCNIHAYPDPNAWWVELRHGGENLTLIFNRDGAPVEHLSFTEVTFYKSEGTNTKDALNRFKNPPEFGGGEIDMNAYWYTSSFKYILGNEKYVPLPNTLYQVLDREKFLSRFNEFLDYLETTWKEENDLSI